MYNEALAEHTTALELAKQQGQSIAIQDNLQVREQLLLLSLSTCVLSGYVAPGMTSPHCAWPC